LERKAKGRIAKGNSRLERRFLLRFNYYWDQAGRIAGEGHTVYGDYTVRYFYSGNEKVAMERYDTNTGETKYYYFINNPQGTPVLIIDEQNQKVSGLNLDEWGNQGAVSGPQQEVNYTGKKLDQATGLYYFNQRYYDPEIGRFIQEDPAGQLLNPYVYSGNSPLMYTDPDGRFFFEIMTAFGGVFGGIYRGLQEVANGGDFGRGFSQGWVDGVKIGGSIGIAADVIGSFYTGGATLATWNEANPFYVAAMSSYVQAWQGTAGTGGSVPVGTSPPRQTPSPGQGGSNRYSDYAEPGTYLPGSGPGKGFRPGTGFITSPYDWRTLNGKDEFHSGVDFSYGDGYAYARYSGFSLKGEDKKGFGNYVVVNRGMYPSQYSIYAHLQSVDPNVQDGGIVFKGQKLGVIGSTGRSTGLHLHYGEFVIQPNGRRMFSDPGF